ncbi:uncharacterized protein [Rutidosis leptorrhynchoides]|uniref:uncharacterized protein isoform X2 n=1 Tax=Rutidosis leptorrhynchoides TaxID=125765 RepID=UPI003A9A412B
MELAVRDSSHMEEIELSNRNTNMFDGAKLKRKRSIDGCDIPRKGNMMLQDKQIADSNTNSDIDINIDWAGGGYLITNLDNLKLVCSDGVSIEAKPFKRESGVVNGFYNNKFGIPIFESDSKTLEMVKEFCVARAYFQDYYAYHYPDSHEESLQKALNWCNSKFLEQYQSNFQATIKIIEAAFELEMISLIHLMMEAVIDLFSDMNEGDVYDFFPVHLINKDDDYEFEEMKSTLGLSVLFLKQMQRQVYLLVRYRTSQL